MSDMNGSARKGLGASVVSSLRGGPQQATATRPGPLQVRVGRAWREAAPALTLYALVRAISVGTVALLASANHRDLLRQLAKTDGGWYTKIARTGYQIPPPGATTAHTARTDIAFFPAYPYLLRGVHDVTGLSWHAAGVAISVVAGFVAAWAIYRICARVAGPRAGLVAMLLWAVEPAAVVLEMAYSEALFMAFAAWSLDALLRRRWVAAGVLAMLAGATRSTAVALIAAIWVGALLAAVKRKDGWRPYVGALLAPFGFVGYLAWTSVATGRLTGWFWEERVGWGSQFDWGRSLVTAAHRALVEHQAMALQVGAVTAGVTIVLVGWLLASWRRVPIELIVFAVLVVVMGLGTAGYLHDKPRFVLPAFPLVLPPAVALVRANLRWALAFVLICALFAGWYGGYLLTEWRFGL